MKKSIIFYAIAIIVCVLITVCTLNINAPTDADRQYFCNDKLMTFTLDVDIEDMNGNKQYNVNGEFFAAYEDDLAMTNTHGDLVLRTNDIYNFISQNEHVIYKNDAVAYRCDGKIKWLADSYDVFDTDGNKIAYVSFNMFDTRGVMYNMDGKVIARYDSALSRYDYIVSIYDDCEIDDESVLMIFASYVSDKRADN